MFRDTFYVVSGFEGNDVFYEKVYYSPDMIYQINFDYPNANKAICDGILTEFMNDFHLGNV